MHETNDKFSTILPPFCIALYISWQSASDYVLLILFTLLSGLFFNMLVLKQYTVSFTLSLSFYFALSVSHQLSFAISILFPLSVAFIRQHHINAKESMIHSCLLLFLLSKSQGVFAKVCTNILSLSLVYEIKSHKEIMIAFI